MKTLPSFFAGAAVMIASGVSAQTTYSSSADTFSAADFSGDGSGEYALHPSVTFSLGNGLSSAGFSRSGVDAGYIRGRILANPDLADLQFIPATNPGLVFAPLDLLESSTPFGIHFDRNFGNIKIGASYRRIDSFTHDANTYGLKLQHQPDSISRFYNLLYYGGIEHVQAGDTNLTSYYLGTEGRADRLRLGVSVGLDNVISKIDLAEIYARYDLTDAISLDATAAQLSGADTNTNLYSLGLEYEFLKDGYLRANYSDTGESFGSESLWEIAAGWRF